VEVIDGREDGGEVVVLGGRVDGGDGGDDYDPGTDGGAEPGLNGGHLLRAKTALKLACVFNPPLVGDEVHDEDGVYPLAGDPEERPA